MASLAARRRLIGRFVDMSVHLGTPTANELNEWFGSELRRVFGDRSGKTELSILRTENNLVDAPTKIVVRGTAGAAVAFILCSNPAAPDMVERAMARAREAKACMGAGLGLRVVEPIAEGRLEGLSYAVLPYCHRLSRSRVLWPLQRAFVAPVLLAWLHALTLKTATPAGDEETEQRFVSPLEQFASLPTTGSPIRKAIAIAIGRLRSGAWRPCQVVMHGDLWKDNVLVRRSSGSDARSWKERLVITDWAGSTTRGYGVYDLVRLGHSLRLPRSRFRHELARHCEALGCQAADAMGYLLAALGHIALNLEHFPMDQFMKLANACVATIDSNTGEPAAASRRF